MGTAFLCIGNSIVLRHSKFTSLEGATGMCNGGLITANSLRAEGDCYTSQLNVVISPSSNNQTVQCAYGGGETLIVGSSTIDITRGIIMIILYLDNTVINNTLPELLS